MRDWYAWHSDYADPSSELSARLATVQEHVRAELDRLPPGPLRAVSMCAGQGHDLLGVLADHPRRDDVSALLVEYDPRNAAAARAAAADAGLTGVRVSEGDAGLVDAYTGYTPADLVLACGVFGNVSDDDIRRTVDACRGLCRRDGAVIWTRHRRGPDLVPQIVDWFEQAGFATHRVSDPAQPRGVAVHRHRADPVPVVPGTRMFTFVEG